MVTPTIRVKSPIEAKRGSVIEIMTLISHTMVTGLRKDKEGKVIPRNIINKFLCIYNDELVFKAELHEAISANPIIQFNFVSEQSGTLELIWHEDGGQIYTTKRELRVLLKNNLK